MWRRLRFKIKIFFHSIYLSLRLRKRVHVNWRIAELVIKKDGYCPCRFGKIPENKCPCKWHLSELKERGRCKCGLFFIRKK